MTIVMTRKDLIAKLNEKLALARAEDEKATVKHRADEKKALKTFRDLLRQAMKWDYKKLKSRHFYISSSGPSCPRREATRFEHLLTSLKLDSRTEFRLSDGSDLFKAVAWLPEAMREKQTICD